jgi:hypothetical protein
MFGGYDVRGFWKSRLEATNKSGDLSVFGFLCFVMTLLCVLHVVESIIWTIFNDRLYPFTSERGRPECFIL